MMKRFSLTKTLLFLLTGLILLSVSACGRIIPVIGGSSGDRDAESRQSDTEKEDGKRKNALPSEKELRAELKKSGRFGVAEPYTIKECKTIKSKTDKENGHYSVWLQIVSESENDVCRQAYLMEYELYDEGWLLSSISPYEEEPWSVTPKRPQTEEEMLSGWKTERTSDWVIEKNEYDLEAGLQEITATYREEHPYCTVYKRIHSEYLYSNYHFGVDLGYASWALLGIPQEEVLREDWHLVGEYKVGRNTMYIDAATTDDKGTIDAFYWHWKDGSSITYYVADLTGVSCSDFFVNICSDLDYADYGSYTATLTNGYWSEFRYAFAEDYFGMIFVGYDRIAYDWDYDCDVARRKLIVTLGNDAVPSDGFEIVNGVLISYSGHGGDVVIPAGVTVIKNEVFYGCSSLESVTIPAGVTEIGASAFSNCSSLKSVTIPESVTEIGEFAFSNCSSLKSVTIPEGVTEIGADAFSFCSSLESVTISESVTEIGASAFYGCRSLESVTIPESVTEIHGNPFPWCSALRSIRVARGNTAFQDIDGVLFDKTGTVLYSCPCGDRDRTSYRIPAGVTEIGESAFCGCSSLKSVTIPESITEIGDYAFNGCSSLESMTIPESITEIGDYAFNGCRGLKSVTIPEGVTQIGPGTFGGCSSLESVTIPEGVTVIGYEAFSDCSSLEHATIPEGVTEIEAETFWGCSSLESVTIPEGVTQIGNGAFKNCSSLKSVTIPEGVTQIGPGAFGGCSSLESVTIPEGVTLIGRRVFRACSGLRSVTIPSSITAIGGGAFNDCSNLKDVYFASTKEHILRVIDLDTLIETDEPVEVTFHFSDD